MKICVICPEIGYSRGGPFIGGHVNNVVQLSKALSARGHEIIIVTTPHRYPGNHKLGKKDDLHEWAEIFTLPISSRYLSVRYGLEFAFKSILKIREIHKAKKIDVIHGHSGYSILALITELSAKTLNLPSIHSIYCPIQVAGVNVVKLFSNEILSKFYFLLINKIIAVSGNVKNSLIRVGIPENKIAEVPIGINTELFNPNVLGYEIRKRYNIDPDQPTLLYVGNLTMQKGLSVLIDALNIVKKDTPNLKLLMVLNLPLERYVKPDKLDVDMELIFEIKDKIKCYGLEDNIIPLGLLDNMPQVMAACDVFITPFLNTVGIADYPVSLLEAMAVGKPVIATKVGGIPEIVRHGRNGLLIEPGNVDDLANAIRYILQNKEEAKNMGKEAAKTIFERFRLETVVDELEKIYEEVISNHSGDRRY